MDAIARVRAEWLAQLANAIDSAQRLAWQLGTTNASSSQARELYGKLEQARVELESLRSRNGGGAPTMDPEWLRKLGWMAPDGDCPD